MGCNFVTLRFPGDLTRDALRKAFEGKQADSRYESGHSYSGEIGMATGLAFDDRTFADFDTAEEYLDGAAPKWGDAVAVTVQKPNGKRTWVVGANCAS